MLGHVIEREFMWPVIIKYLLWIQTENIYFYERELQHLWPYTFNTYGVFCFQVVYFELFVL